MSGAGDRSQAEPRLGQQGLPRAIQERQIEPALERVVRAGHGAAGRWLSLPGGERGRLLRIAERILAQRPEQGRAAWVRLERGVQLLATEADTEGGLAALERSGQRKLD